MHKLLSFFIPFTAFALPQGAQVTGNAAIAVQGQEMHIKTNTRRTAIDWQNFSIAHGEAVHFMQPTADSAVLNNVMSGSISHLMGALESNGKVYIINPNGIILGKDACINVHSLIASTLKITHEEFFAGKDHFVGSEQSKVINLGTLRANGGDIHVISYQVDNQGTITAPEGTVALSAANEAWLQSTDKRVLIKTTLGEASDNDGITNLGTIHALQTELDADGNLYKFAINHSGTIDATSLKTENGRVFLRAEQGCAKVAGTITALGGHVEVLAERIGIDDAALIDVSHATRGGVILIGGDARGATMPFRATHTYLGARAVLRADGVGYGSGGRVVLWGDLSARVFGSVSACGGALGGHGGQIEVSRVPILASKSLDTHAPHGKTGTLLLDPANVTITASTTTSGIDLSVDPATYSGLLDDINIGADAIVAALSSNDVVIQASTLGTGSGTGNITVNSAIAWSAANSLTLEASETGAVQINQDITSTGDGSLTLRGQSILVGSSDHSHANVIAVSTTGYTTATVNIEFNAAGGILGVYTGVDGSGNSTAATVDAANSALTIGKASGFSGTAGNIEVKSGPVASDKTVAAASITSGRDVAITANAITVEVETGASGQKTGAAHITQDGLGLFGMSVAATGPIVVTNAGPSGSALGDDAKIAAVGVNGLTISSSASVTVRTSASGAGDAEIENSGGDLAITSSGEITVENIASNTASHASFLVTGSGNLTINNGLNNVTISSANTSGTNGIARIYAASGSVNINTTGRVALYSAAANNFAEIFGGDIHIGTAEARIAYLDLRATNATAQSYITGAGDVSIYGTRIPSMDAPVVSLDRSTTTLGAVTPGSGDVYVEASGNIIFDTGFYSSVTSGKRTIFHAIDSSSNITIGARGSTDTSALIDLGGSQEMVIEAGVDGTVQFYETLERSGTGSMTISAANILVGSSDNVDFGRVMTNTGDVTLNATGVGSKTLGVYAGISGASWILAQDSNASVSITGNPDVTIKTATNSAVIQGGAVTGNVGALTIQSINSGEAAWQSVASGEISATGNIHIAAAGTGRVRLVTDTAYAEGQDVTIESTGGGDAFIHALRIGSTTSRVGALTMTTTSTGQAYIRADNHLQIYGARRGSSQVISTPGSCCAAALGAFVPADGDVYIYNNGEGYDITLDLESFTSSSAAAGSATYVVATRDIHFGALNQGDSPMWALNSAQDMVLEVGSAGTIQFNEGLTNTGTGTLMLKGGAVQIGQSDHTHTNQIAIAPTGALTVDFLYNSGALKIYGSDTDGKTAYLTSHAASSAITVQETSGKSGAAVIMSGGSEALFGSDGTNYAQGVSITLNAGASAGSSHKSIDMTGRSELASDAAMLLNVPRAIELDEGAHIYGSGLTQIYAENITVASATALTSGITALNNLLEITALGKITVSSTSSGGAYITGVDNCEIKKAVSGIDIVSSSGGSAYISALNHAGDLDIGWTSKEDIGNITIAASGAGAAYMATTGSRSVKINGPGAVALTSSGAGNAYISSVADVVMGGVTGDGRKAMGAITTASTAGAGQAFITATGAMTVRATSLGVQQQSSHTLSRAYLQALGGDLAITTSANMLIESTNGGGGVGSITTEGATHDVQLTSGGTITSNSGLLSSDMGDVVMVADSHVLLQGSCVTRADAGSVIIACDQATEAPGIGHVDISAGSSLISGDKLRIFCGYFENNTISTSANLNGGTFSGVIDVPDAHNVYGIIYDAGSLPAHYTAPYTFYYEALTPEQVVTEQIERANILLSATMVASSTLSQDAAYTKLAQLRRGFVNRGMPFMYGDGRKRKRR